MDKLLEVRDLRVYFYGDGVELPAVDGISYSVNRGETLCIVGESGCGKSVSAMSIVRLVPVPPGRYVSGDILFDGTDVLQASQQEMEKFRGKEISVIFQEPMTALNPVHTIGAQIAEVFITHENVTQSEAHARAVQMLKLVGVPDAERCAASYPHQLSGGMRQRVLIAMAFACRPKFLIADEPTTALDVTIQAQILDIIRQLKDRYGMTVLFVTHDMGIVAEIADRVLVMYSGRVVEDASCRELFANPMHPYTRGLLRCIPRVDSKVERLDVIEGRVPSLGDFPTGCRFHPRCPECMEVCKIESPDLLHIDGRRVACHLYTEVGV